MILLRKFLTFPHNRDFCQITYGAYKFVIDEYEYIWFINFGKESRKTFINYKIDMDRPLATFQVGSHKITMRQTCFLLMNTLDYTEYYLINLCCEVSDVGNKKFIDEYARIME